MIELSEDVCKVDLRQKGEKFIADLQNLKLVLIV